MVGCMDASTSSARYDGIADWYDAQMEAGPHRDAVLRANLPRGTGTCLDVGCGTGRNLPIIEELGWTATGVDISEDQLRLARKRSPRVQQADAEDLPFDSESFDLVMSAWTSTDVDDFGRMVSEAARVLRPAGMFMFYGVHPCFNGPHVHSLPAGEVVVHPTYREARRHESAPWWGEDGIRHRVGGMRQVPLSEFLNAFVDAGLRIERVTEPGENDVPVSIIVLASKDRVPTTP
jgi:ubiquinone/menaquinone biosynthesis C-methylase UbiE